MASLILMVSSIAWTEPFKDMHNMPGMSKKASPKKTRTATRKRKPAKKHNMDNMPGMSMSGMHKHARRKKRIARKRQPTTKHQMGNMPGMKMPQTSPSPSSSPQKMQMNMPGMQMPTAS